MTLKPPSLRHLVAYGSTNKYRPVNRSKASGSSGEYVTQGGGIPLPCARATKLAMTVTVKAMDTQRWICRTHLFQFTVTSVDSRLLSRLRRPVGRDPELLGVLGVQSLPATELHRLGTNDAADGSSAEKVIQHIEA